MYETGGSQRGNGPNPDAATVKGTSSPGVDVFSSRCEDQVGVSRECCYILIKESFNCKILHKINS